MLPFALLIAPTIASLSLPHEDCSCLCVHLLTHAANASPIVPSLNDRRTCFEVNGTYGTTLFVDRAVRILDAHGSAAAAASSAATAAATPAAHIPTPPPFFLYLALQNVHWPLQAPQPYLSRFANRTGGSFPR